MFKSVSLLLAGTALLALLPPAAFADTPAKSQIVVLDKSLSQLRADFNANAGKVRLLYIVGPTCGICLRALSDLQESLYSKNGDDPRIVTFVVHVPTLGAHEANAQDASSLISNRYTTNYWEESGIIGREAEARLKQEVHGFDRYTWDFYAAYGPQAKWTDETMIPAPNFWQDQLYGLPADKMLNAEDFAAKVDELLAEVPATAAAAPDAGRRPKGR